MVKYDPGYCEIQFNATNLASGVYFYRMQAGSYVETKSLLLVKVVPMEGKGIGPTWKAL